MNEVWILIRDIAPVAALFGGPLLGWILWSLRQDYVRRTRCETHRESIRLALAENEKKQSDLDRMIQKLPSQGDIKDLRNALSSVSTEFAGIKASMQALDRNVERMDGRVAQIDMFLRTGGNG